MKPGLYPTMPMAEYLSIQAFSSGLGQRILSQSPLHAWVESPWNERRFRDDSDTADIGTFAHAMLLEGKHTNLVVIEADDWRTKAAKEQRDAARAEGKLPILARKLGEVEQMVKSAKLYLGASEIGGIFDTGAAEQTVVGEVDGVLCKARPDWLAGNKKRSLSYKTTAGSAQPDAWIRTQLPGYDMGISLYEYLISDVLGVEGGCKVVTLCQEQKFPFACSLIALAPAWRELANRKLSRALEIWKGCLESGKFPAYPSQICHAEPPAYLMNSIMEQEMEEGGIEYDVSKIWEKP